MSHTIATVRRRALWAFTRNVCHRTPESRSPTYEIESLLVAWNQRLTSRRHDEDVLWWQ
jgi:hypothetical protein